MSARRPCPLTRITAFERWNGQGGPGNLNALACMQRAIDLTADHGIACVGLSNTNHWMRGGSYGWQAADAGVIGVCWTNTLPNMPPWGASEPRIGNNPLIVAIPHPPAPRRPGHGDVAVLGRRAGLVSLARRSACPCQAATT